MSPAVVSQPMQTTFDCARAGCGQAAAAPSAPMNSRRLMLLSVGNDYRFI